MKKNSENECGPREEGAGGTGSKFQGFSGSNGAEHGECCDECRRTCKRNFWTEVLRTLVKVGTAVMAALGLSSWVNDPTE